MIDNQEPFLRMYQVSKRSAAVEQIESAIEAFHLGRFATVISLAAAAEGMADDIPGGMWERMKSLPDGQSYEPKAWIARLNATRDWLKHNRSESTRNLVAFEAALYVLRAMDKWTPLTPAMQQFECVFYSSRKFPTPDEFEAGLAGQGIVLPSG